MAISLRCGAVQQAKRLIAALLVATTLLEALRGASLVPRVAAETPAPTPYVRQTYKVDVGFFAQYWWVGFILIFLGVLFILFVIRMAVKCHFRESEQHRRRKFFEMKKVNPDNIIDDDDDVGSDVFYPRSQSGRSQPTNPLCGRH
ncbi:hypothetical protein JKF63_07883 [Porcisia hertigi]|uniref:Uncharacterized protein n=1 Tax=Porcisia hertigi TaxID=2761500 RepID=A0A837A923_9TRYP|nr:hypothetical protein JKF63_07883 [Porcisia hertigi]